MTGSAAAGESQIEGVHAVLEALRAGRNVHKVFLAREGGGRLTEVARLARARGVPVVEVPRRFLARRAATPAHQGVLALVAPRPPAALREVLDLAAARGEPPLVLVAAGVQDPRNLGSLVRSAEAAGAHGLCFPVRRGASLGPAALKAAAGAAEHLPLWSVVNVSQALRQLKEAGLWVAGAEPLAGLRLWEADLTGPCAVVVGGEERGLPAPVRRACDLLVSIPMLGRIESLNVAVAGALLLFEARRQRMYGPCAPRDAKV